MFTNHVYKWTKRLKHKRRLIEGLSRMMIICTALMTWKGLIFVTKSESPVIVILRWVYPKKLSCQTIPSLIAAKASATASISSLSIIITYFAFAYSGGAGPAFQRGDILFLNNQEDSIRIGELVAFTMKDSDVPIVHRVFKVHEKQDGKVSIGTCLVILVVSNFRN